MTKVKLLLATTIIPAFALACPPQTKAQTNPTQVAQNNPEQERKRPGAAQPTKPAPTGRPAAPPPERPRPSGVPAKPNGPAATAPADKQRPAGPTAPTRPTTAPVETPRSTTAPTRPTTGPSTTTSPGGSPGRSAVPAETQRPSTIPNRPTTGPATTTTPSGSPGRSAVPADTPRPSTLPNRPATGPATGPSAVREPQRIDALRGQRREERQGDRTIIRENDRTIVREGNRAFIRHNEMDRFQPGNGRFNRDVRIERRGNDTQAVMIRPGGVQIINVFDADGRLIRRIRRGPDGREFVIIDNRPRGPSGFFVQLPPPVIRIPRERYIYDWRRGSPDEVYGVLMLPPVEPLQRAYSLDEIRYSAPLRDRMPRVDLDTITFDTGSWEIRPDQMDVLSVIADALQRAIQANPDEVFLIEGHTDAVGSDIDNLSLSDRRAESVAQALTEQFGIPPENLTSQGYGEQNLKIPTDGPEPRNRYVTVRRITPLLTGQN